MTSHQTSGNVVPLMEGDAFTELVTDIKVNGLREPVMVFENKVLDGRNRYRACEEIGIQPEIEYFNGQDPVAY
ncbi:MAG TPA: ParB N-terminal domain-containing protein, partial [Methyloceanibacter sp.]|nr:ParB N-terminal domain-containing protein [Methyloceanibacter sp.]